jgi:hypothetical protein
MTANTRQPPKKNTIIKAKTCTPWSVSVGMASKRAVACVCMSEGVEFFRICEGLIAAMP